MDNLIEEVLKFSYEEKLKLMLALRADLERDDELQQDNLSKEQWAEIYRREKMLESGETGVMTSDEFKQKLNAFSHDV